MKKTLIITFLLLFLQETTFAMDITSSFGSRIHPITQEESFHNGIDIAGEMGSPIPAVLSGQIVYADWYEGFGNTVIIYHGDSVYTLYGHCSKLIVSAGQNVEQGKIIALVGSTGNSTGPHLHLSLVRNNEYINPMIIWQ